MEIKGLNPGQRHTLTFANGVALAIAVANQSEGSILDYDPFEEFVRPERRPFRECSFASDKEKLLQHYSEREPNEFVQYDLFTDMWGDSCLQPDEDGDALCCGRTQELMHGAAVRVLVRPDTGGAAAARALRKIAGLIEREGLWSTREQTSPSTPELLERMGLSGTEQQGIDPGILRDLSGSDQEREGDTGGAASS